MYHRVQYLARFYFYATLINDLPSSVSSDVRLFADDCLLYLPIKSKDDQKKTARGPGKVGALGRHLGG